MGTTRHEPSWLPCSLLQHLPPWWLPLYPSQSHSPRISSRRGLLADGWPAGMPRSSSRGTGLGGSRVSGILGERWMSGVGAGSVMAEHGAGAGVGGACGGSPRSRPRPPGGCRSRPRPSEASRAVPRSSARCISLGVPELLPRSAGPGFRGSSGSGLGRWGLPVGRGHMD